MADLVAQFRVTVKVPLGSVPAQKEDGSNVEEVRRAREHAAKKADKIADGGMDKLKNAEVVSVESVGVDEA